MGNLGPLGFRGLFRDNTGTCLMAYSDPMGSSDVITAEIQALVVGMRIASSLDHHLIVEGDLGSWSLANHIKETRSLASMLNRSFHYIPREANSSADLCMWVVSLNFLLIVHG